MTEDVSKLPAIRRRYLTVVSESEFSARLSAGARTFSYEELAFAALPLLFPVRLPLKILSLAVSGAAVSRIGQALVGRHERDNGSMILQIPESQAHPFRFSTGLPELRTVYAVNPYATSTYYPVGAFHYNLLEHKIAELIGLLQALGAKSYAITHHTASGKSFHSSAEASAPGVAAGSGSLKAHQDLAQSLEKAGKLPGGEPHLPDDLSWFYNEDSWRTIADGRLKYGQSIFHDVVELNSDFGVNASLKAAAKGLKLDAGSDYSAAQRLKFDVRAEF